MLGSFVRVLTGFLLGCIAAALIQVLYLPTTYQLAASADNTFPGSQVVERILLVATHIAIFSAAFALIMAGLSAWTGRGSLPYYLTSGTVIGLLGFVAQYASEVASQPTIFNNSAVTAYLTSGFFAGLAYWLVAGDAGENTADDFRLGERATIGVPPPRSWKNRPKIVVDESQGVAEGAVRPKKKPSLSDVLRGNEVQTEIKPAVPKSDNKTVVVPAPAKPTPASGTSAPAATSTSVPLTKSSSNPAAANEPVKKV